MLVLHAGLLMTVAAVCIQGSLSQTQCNYGDVRLVDGPASNEGVVEFCIDANWGTICADDEWGRNDATVICRQLGYPYNFRGVDSYEDFDGQGNTVVSNVKCGNPFNNGRESVLDCSIMMTTECSERRLAYIACRDEERVQNVSAELVITASVGSVHMASVTWMQNVSAAEPTSFEVKCHNGFNSITVTVNNKTTSTEQIGLLPLSIYNCCVSAVYRNAYRYVARERCTQIETPDLVVVDVNTSTMSCATHEPCPITNNIPDTGLSTEFDHETSDIVRNNVRMNSDSFKATNSTSIVGGVLGFIIILLLVLLIISVVALVCVLRQSARLKNSALYGRSTTVPAYDNANYVSQLPTSRTQPQAVRPATAQPESGATAPNYSSIGPDYESIESRRQVQMEGGSNRVNMRERYEFAEIHAETDGQNGVQGSMDYEVPVVSVPQSTEDYSRLQH